VTWLLHWGERINWAPIAFLGGAAILLFLTRLLTVSFWWHRLRKAEADSDPSSQEREFEKITTECLDPSTHPVPAFVSLLYSLAYLAFAAAALWGTIRTAWWALPLALLAMILVHVPFRESMSALNQLQKISAARD
jgi:hypothetical protein